MINKEIKSYIKDFYKMFNTQNKINLSKELHEQKLMNDLDYQKYLLLLAKELAIPISILEERA